jgi:hypothetical protein
MERVRTMLGKQSEDSIGRSLSEKEIRKGEDYVRKTK